MKQAFVYPGGPGVPDRPKAVRWGINRLYWAANDPQCTPQLLKEFRAAGMGVGLMRDPDWTPGIGAKAYAEQLSQDLTDHGFGASTGPDSCAVLADAEVPHDPRWHEDWIKRFRELRPTRTLLWTFEPMQGGWIDQALANRINTDPNIQVIPQAYLGSPRMYPVSERKLIENVVSTGINPARIHTFYDGEKEIPYGWDGIVYDFIKLADYPPTAL